MKRPLLEAEKNYLKCSILMLICGVLFFSMHSTLGGGICTGLAVLFGIMTIYLYKNADPEVVNKMVEKQKRMKENKEVEEIKKEETKKEEIKKEAAKKEAAKKESEKSDK